MAGLDKRDKKFSDALAREYDKLLIDIEKHISYYYQKYAKEDVLAYRDMMQYLNEKERNAIFKNFDTFVENNPKYKRLLPIRNSIYKLNRLEGLQMSTRIRIAELGIVEENQMADYLASSYDYGYKATMKHLENSDAFFNVDKKLLNQTLNAKWFDDKNFSDRIWENKDRLRLWFNTTFRDGLATGKTYDEMLKDLAKKTDTGAFYAKRLVWTESSYMLNSANAHAFMESGVKKYRFIAIIDGRTSVTCRGLNDEVFEFKNYQPGLNAPPMHSFCRSGIVPEE